MAGANAKVSTECIEILFASIGDARVSLDLIEALCPVLTATTNTITGAGVSQYLVEALIANTSAIKVVQEGVEVLFSLDAVSTEVTKTVAWVAFG